ncbi:TlpA family protein disulfide reductase [Streptomyces sp. NPDC058818]|uniref:TlpA family protein disulfide reductase n=1 Tax=Streptomyces sp. NPDC058818 TaxID=3346640 RepID=UPI0036A00111
MPRRRRNRSERVREQGDGGRLDTSGPQPDISGPRLDTSGPRLDAADLGAELGARATLVQFSSAFCAPCRATRRVLGDVAGLVPGVTHVEIDAEARLELVRALDVLKTPTVLVLDAGGRVVRRAVGQPRKADVIAALGEAL